MSDMLDLGYMPKRSFILHFLMKRLDKLNGGDYFDACGAVGEANEVWEQLDKFAPFEQPVIPFSSIRNFRYENMSKSDFVTRMMLHHPYYGLQKTIVLWDNLQLANKGKALVFTEEEDSDEKEEDFVSTEEEGSVFTEEEGSDEKEEDSDEKEEIPEKNPEITWNGLTEEEILKKYPRVERYAFQCKSPCPLPGGEYYVCSRTKAHEGPHVASHDMYEVCTADTGLCIWEDEKEKEIRPCINTYLIPLEEDEYAPVLLEEEDTKTKPFWENLTERDVIDGYPRATEREAHCESIFPKGPNFSCSRPKEHKGPHVAYFDKNLVCKTGRGNDLCIWENENEDNFPNTKEF